MYTNLIPTGFRFNPTDEELLLFLRNKANGNQLPPYIPITNEDVYACEPYDLPWGDDSRLKDNERYYFVIRQPMSSKNEKLYKKSKLKRLIKGENINKGGWRVGPPKKEIFNKQGILIGVKNVLTFFKTKTIKSDWIMHELILPDNNFQELAICRIKNNEKEKNTKEKQITTNKRNREDFEDCTIQDFNKVLEKSSQINSEQYMPQEANFQSGVTSTTKAINIAMEYNHQVFDKDYMPQQTEEIYHVGVTRTTEAANGIKSNMLDNNNYFINSYNNNTLVIDIPIERNHYKILDKAFMPQVEASYQSGVTSIIKDANGKVPSMTEKNNYFINYDNSNTIAIDIPTENNYQQILDKNNSSQGQLILDGKNCMMNDFDLSYMTLYEVNVLMDSIPPIQQENEVYNQSYSQVTNNDDFWMELGDLNDET